MRYLKLFLDFIFNSILNLKLIKIIHSEDYKHFKSFKKNENQLTSDQRFLFENGYLLIENFFGEEEVDQFNKNINFENKKRNCNVSNIVIEKGSLLEKFLGNSKINSLLRSYLGNQAQLDFLEINRLTSNPERKSVSEKWHYDCVGRRIKIFIFLNSCNSIYTDYVKSTNLNKHLSYTTGGSRRTDKFIKKKYKNIFSAKPKKGSIFIFDTNGYHQGSYRNSTQIEKRDTIQLEFSNFEKSKKLLNLGIDSIGIRDIFFDKNFNFSDTLVNKGCLVYFKEKNFYAYDYKFAKF